MTYEDSLALANAIIAALQAYDRDHSTSYSRYYLSESGGVEVLATILQTLSKNRPEPEQTA